MSVAVRKFVISPPERIKLFANPIAGLSQSLPGDRRALKLISHMHDILTSRDPLAANDFFQECDARTKASITKAATRTNDPIEAYKNNILRLLRKIYLERENYSDTKIGDFRIRLNKLLDKVPEIKDALAHNILLTYDQIKNCAFDDDLKRRLSTPYHEFIDLIKESPLGVDLDPIIDSFYSLFKDPRYPEFDISEAGKALYETSAELTNTPVCAFIDGLLLKDDPVDLRDILTVTLFLDSANKDSLGYNFQIKGGHRELRQKISRDLKWLNARAEALARRVEIDPETTHSLSNRDKLFEEITLNIKQILERARQFAEC